MPVLNFYHNPLELEDGVRYTEIGRGSIFGNPFTHMPLEKTNAMMRLGSREAAIEMYRLWITSDLQVRTSDRMTPILHDVCWPKPTRELVKSLHGKRLVCYCKPAACHGDVLLELAAKWTAEDNERK